jgi:GTPase SAR1 family protein
LCYPNTHSVSLRPLPHPFAPYKGKEKFVSLTRRFCQSLHLPLLSVRNTHTLVSITITSFTPCQGEEKFDSLTNFYCRNAKAAFVVYDITDRRTFDGLNRWLTKIQSEAAKDCSIGRFLL